MGPALGPGTLAPRFASARSWSGGWEHATPESPKAACDLNWQEQLQGGQEVGVPVGRWALASTPAEWSGLALPFFSFLPVCHGIVLYWIRHTFLDEKALNFA